jgi:hypothetical protein
MKHARQSVAKVPNAAPGSWYPIQFGHQTTTGRERSITRTGCMDDDIFTNKTGFSKTRLANIAKLLSTLSSMKLDP